MNKRLFFMASLFFSIITHLSANPWFGLFVKPLVKPRIGMLWADARACYHPSTVVGLTSVIVEETIYSVRVFSNDTPFIVGLKSNIETFTSFECWILKQGSEQTFRSAIEVMLSYLYDKQSLVYKNSLQQIIFERARPQNKYDLLFDVYCQVVNAALASDHEFFAALNV